MSPAGLPSSPLASAVPPGIVVRASRPEDADAVIEIRSDAIRTSDALWIDEVPPRAEALAWFAGHLERGSLLVAAAEGSAADAAGHGEVIGFATHSPLRPYAGYRETAEDSIYLAEAARGRGVGRVLLEALIGAATSAGMHSLIGMIEASNTASIALHDRCGFTEVGRIPEAGLKFGRRLDLVIMQRLL